MKRLLAFVFARLFGELGPVKRQREIPERLESHWVCEPESTTNTGKVLIKSLSF